MKLYFRNIKSEIIEVKTVLLNTPIKSKWYELLQNVLKNDSVAYVKTFSLVGGFSQNRTPNIITKQLIEGIKLLKSASWYPEYNNINEPFESLLENFDRDLLNKLHHHFELLQGQIWNPSSFLYKASGEERFAISKLNLCCHELEGYYDSMFRKDQGLDHGIYFYYSVCGTPSFKEITANEKIQFSRTIKNGMIYLHYAQTGKTWYEAYCDHDDLVDVDNITEHRLMSGEFSCYVGKEFEFIIDKDFKKFITDKGFAWDDPNLAIGYCPIGQIISIGNISIDNYQECQTLLEEYDDFYAIVLDDGTTKYYDYRHNDQTYYDKICGVMNTWKQMPKIS